MKSKINLKDMDNKIKFILGFIIALVGVYLLYVTVFQRYSYRVCTKKAAKAVEDDGGVTTEEIDIQYPAKYSHCLRERGFEINK